jgi:hypothetical protein
MLAWANLAVFHTGQTGIGARPKILKHNAAAGLIVNFMTGSQQDLWLGH